MGGTDHSGIPCQIDRVTEIVCRLGVGCRQLGLLDPAAPGTHEDIGGSGLGSIVIVAIGTHQNRITIHGHAAAEEVVGLAVGCDQHRIVALAAPASGRLLVEIDRAFRTILPECSNGYGLAVEIQDGAEGITAVQSGHAQGRFQIPVGTTSLIDENLSRDQRIVFTRRAHHQRVSFQTESTAETTIRRSGRGNELHRLGHGCRPAACRLDIDIDCPGIRSVFVVIQSRSKHDSVTTDSERNTQEIAVVSIHAIGSGQLGDLLPTTGGSLIDIGCAQVVVIRKSGDDRGIAIDCNGPAETGILEGIVCDQFRL